MAEMGKEGRSNMRPKDLIFYSVIVLVVTLLTVNVVLNTFLNKNWRGFLRGDTITNDNIVQKESMCTSRPSISLSDLSDPQIKALSLYQERCNSFVADKLMVFTDMPKDNNVAKKNATVMAEKLKIFAANGIEPVVIAEPETEWGLIDFEEFKSGFYNEWLNTYFTEIKNQGISDKQMGTWVPFPEPNLPYWNHANARPEDFSGIVNTYSGILKTSFPGAKISLLLNSATYETDDFDWRSGEYVSLARYVEGIKKEYISSFGLQGFPWVPPADEAGQSVEAASEFLNHRLAVEAADILEVKNIWFNTGTFGRKYTDSDKSVAYVSPGRRMSILDSVVVEAQKVKNSGYDVSINLFAENKSTAKEATDWSYLGGENSSSDSAAFSNFVAQLYSNSIGFSVYDVAR